jgi:hypothetical protein
MKPNKETSMHIDAEAIIKYKIRPEDLAIAVDILQVAWWPTKQAFVFNTKDISESLNKTFPDRDYEEKLINNHLDGIKPLFIIFPDGKWSPNPIYFHAFD